MEHENIKISERGDPKEDNETRNGFVSFLSNLIRWGLSITFYTVLPPVMGLLSAMYAYEVLGVEKRLDIGLIAVFTGVGVMLLGYAVERTVDRAVTWSKKEGDEPTTGQVRIE